MCVRDFNRLINLHSNHSRELRANKISLRYFSQVERNLFLFFYKSIWITILMLCDNYLERIVMTDRLIACFLRLWHRQTHYSEDCTGANVPVQYADLSFYDTKPVSDKVRPRYLMCIHHAFISPFSVKFLFPGYVVCAEHDRGETLIASPHPYRW